MQLIEQKMWRSDKKKKKFRRGVYKLQLKHIELAECEGRGGMWIRLMVHHGVRQTKEVRNMFSI